jgi:hypothetical protein
MLVQMRSPFTGRWLKINPENGAIVEVALAAWQDIPHLPVIAPRRAEGEFASSQPNRARSILSAS